MPFERIRKRNDDVTLDYDVPMENEPDNIDDSQYTTTHNGQGPSHLSFDPWKKINGMQNVIKMPDAANGNRDTRWTTRMNRDDLMKTLKAADLVKNKCLKKTEEDK